MKENALYPEYFDNFNCIADKCKNTCCGGWDILIDKKTLKKYKNSNHPIIKEKRKGLFINNSKGTMFKLDEHLMCPFLDKENLCSLHKEIGSSLLCDTCKLYPRKLKKIDNTLELGLTASCEAAAKLILDNKDGISFITGKYSNDLFNPINQDTSIGPLLKRYFWPIRVFIIEMLQYRELLIEERLSVIGLFINKLKNVTTENEIEELIEYYTQQVYSGIYKDMFKSLNNYKELLIIQTNLLNSIQISILKSSHKHLNKGLNDNLFSGNFDMDLYIETHESTYREFISDKQYITENYLVNTFFNTSQIFSDFESLNKIYIGLVIRAGLIKNITTNALILNNNLTIEQLIDLISRLSRKIDHSNGINKEIVKVFKNNNFDSTSNLLVLTV